MAKGDFELDEQEYDVVYEDKRERKRKNLANKIKNKSKNDSRLLEDTSDLGDFANASISNNEPKKDILDKLINTVKNANVRTLIVIFGTILISFVIILVISVTISRINKSYNADIIIPDILYVGETSGISVISSYSGETPPKRNISEVVSTFKINDDNIVALVSESAIGSNITNPLIPKQEGKTTIEVSASLNGRVLESVKKEVMVCPEFDSNLWLVSNISIPINKTYKLRMDSIPEECTKDVTYTSLNEKVAIIDDDALITALGVGSTSIVVKKGDRSFNIKVEVTEYSIRIQNLSFTDSIVQLSPGDSYKLKLNYMPFNASSFDIDLRSRNEDVVKVNKEGVLTAVAPGETTVRLSSTSFSKDAEVRVIVNDKNSSMGEIISFELGETSLNMTQGNVEKLGLLVYPNTVSKDIVKWRSSDQDIVYVTNDGFVYARNQGKAVVEAYTENGLKKQVMVSVNKMKTPNIIPSDHISSNNWHNKAYVLNFPVLQKGAMYYLGTDSEGINSNKELVRLEGVTNYYVRACTRICSKVCKKDGENEVCKSKCAPNPFICSDAANYVSKLDITKPVVKSVIPVIDKVGTVQITIEDKTSLVSRWCVSQTENYVNCKWKNIEPSIKPTVEFSTNKIGTYYAFARDVAGNISRYYKFEIN